MCAFSVTLSCLTQTPWTVAHQAPLSTEFSGQENCSGWPFPSPGDLPNPGIKPGSPELQTDSLTFEPPGKPHSKYRYIYNLYVYDFLKFLCIRFFKISMYKIFIGASRVAQW